MSFPFENKKITKLSLPKISDIWTTKLCQVKVSVFYHYTWVAIGLYFSSIIINLTFSPTFKLIGFKRNTPRCFKTHNSTLFQCAHRTILACLPSRTWKPLQASNSLEIRKKSKIPLRLQATRLTQNYSFTLWWEKKKKKKSGAFQGVKLVGIRRYSVDQYQLAAGDVQAPSWFTPQNASHQGKVHGIMVLVWVKSCCETKSGKVATHCHQNRIGMWTKRQDNLVLQKQTESYIRQYLKHERWLTPQDE